MELTSFPETSWTEKIIYSEREKIKSNVIWNEILFVWFIKKKKKSFLVSWDFYVD